MTQETQYLNLLRTVLETGTLQSNRTGIKTLFIPGAMLQFDLRQGFPAMTTKKLAFKSVVGELLGFLRGYDNAAKFRELGCKIWDQNANENQQWLTNPNRKGTDDLGRIYGVQWTDWPVYEMTADIDGKIYYSRTGTINQINSVLQKLYTNPTDRRMIITAWRPDDFSKMALPPCHVLYQFIANVEKKELHLCMYQRSCDLFLGIPFNIASASLFLTIMANLSGFTPATFTHFLADVHIYETHIDAVKIQLERNPFAPPTLIYTGPVYNGKEKFKADVFGTIEPSHFTLDNYQYHSAIKAPMAV